MYNYPVNSIAQLPAKDGADRKLLAALCGDCDRMIVAGTQRYSRYGLMFDTRYALWAGQNDWGTKETEDAFPWPGASDTRVRLADKIIKKRKRWRQAAFDAKRIQAQGLMLEDKSKEVIVNRILKWLLYVKTPAMVRRETKLGWSYMDTYGACVMACFWKRQTHLQATTLDLRQMANMAIQQQNPAMLQGVQTIADPLSHDLAVSMMGQHFPDHSKGELAGIVRKLRRGQPAEIRLPYLAANEPNWLALRPGIDCFHDAAIDNLENAQHFVVRELLTEADVRERQTSMGWNEDFIEQAVKFKGRTGLDMALDPLRLSPRGTGGRRSVLAEDTDLRIEILTSFYPVHEQGTTALYMTTYHRNARDVAAWHGLLSYDHGKIPAVAWRCETEERPILESRGIPEMVLTWQLEEKWERDFSNDRLALEILPTLQVPRGFAGEVLLGPAQQLERKRPGDYEFLQPPEVSQAAQRGEAQRTQEICEYFGFFHPAVSPQDIQLAQQELVADTLADLVPIIQQTWQLAQQYLTDEEVMAVAGPLAQGIRLGRDDIRGQYLFEMTYDVRTTDPEFLGNVMGAVERLVAMDKFGTIDINGLIAELFPFISPELAEKCLRPAQQAQMQDVDDTLHELAGIAAGIEPTLKPVTNAQLRLQTLQQAMRSPRLQQIIQNDNTGVTQKLLQNQVERYQFSLQQTQNAQTGRVGVKPVLGDGSGLPNPAQTAAPALTGAPAL